MAEFNFGDGFEFDASSPESIKASARKLLPMLGLIEIMYGASGVGEVARDLYRKSSIEEDDIAEWSMKIELIRQTLASDPEEMVKILKEALSQATKLDSALQAVKESRAQYDNSTDEELVAFSTAIRDVLPNALLAATGNKDALEAVRKQRENLATKNDAQLVKQYMDRLNAIPAEEIVDLVLELLNQIDENVLNDFVQSFTQDFTEDDAAKLAGAGLKFATDFLTATAETGSPVDTKYYRANPEFKGALKKAFQAIEDAAIISGVDLDVKPAVDAYKRNRGPRP